MPTQTHSEVCFTKLRGVSQSNQVDNRDYHKQLLENLRLHMILY
jgi:hypothetical protein